MYNQLCGRTISFYFLNAFSLDNQRQWARLTIPARKDPKGKQFECVSVSVCAQNKQHSRTEIHVT
jgi:hypothetical protein